MSQADQDRAKSLSVTAVAFAVTSTAPAIAIALAVSAAAHALRAAWVNKKTWPSPKTGHVLRSGGAHLRGARPLGTCLDIELHPLATDQPIEVE